MTARRPPVFAACLVFGLLGLILALPSFGGLVGGLKEGAAAWQDSQLPLPRPRSILWVEGLRPVWDSLAGSERLLVAATFLLLLCAFGLLASLLNPAFRLLKEPEERVGSGMGAHVDVARVLRFAAAVAVSLWLIGALAPFAMALTGGGRRLGPVHLILAGFPSWVLALPGVPFWLTPFVHALVMVPLLWLIWGPGGLAAPGPKGVKVALWPWALLAGPAAIPALLVLDRGPFWLGMASRAYSLAARPEWTLLLLLALVLPVAACLFLVFHARLMRPRPGWNELRAPALAALGLAAFSGAAAVWVRSGLDRLDASRRVTLAGRLNTRRSTQVRFALILPPGREPIYSSVPENTATSPSDEVPINPQTMEGAERFLRERNYRTALAFRAFFHMHDSAAVEWLSDKGIRYDLQMLENFPQPAAANLLMERLSDCPVTPENRAALDRFSDPARFLWPEPVGRRWLGAAYLRFGDNTRARDYLLKADLSPDEFRQALGGISPLTNGTVRGRMTISGKEVLSIRLGLVREERWPGMVGGNLPFAWRYVCAVAHTDAKGRYEFRNIPEGRYVLVVTGGDIGRVRGEPLASPHPGVIELDRFHPLREVPSFDIRFTAPVEGPRLDEGSTTA